MREYWVLNHRSYHHMSFRKLPFSIFANAKYANLHRVTWSLYYSVMWHIKSDIVCLLETYDLNRCILASPKYTLALIPDLYWVFTRANIDVWVRLFLIRWVDSRLCGTAVWPHSVLTDVTIARDISHEVRFAFAFSSWFWCIICYLFDCLEFWDLPI